MSDAGKRRALVLGGVALYALGMGCLGGIVGLLTGMSQTSAVTTVLGGVFALLGAAGSFYLPWTQAVPATSRETAADAAVGDAIAKSAERKAALTAAIAATDAAASAHKESERAVADAQRKVGALENDANEAERKAAEAILEAARTAEAATVQALATAQQAQSEAKGAADEVNALVKVAVHEADAAATKVRDAAMVGVARTYLVSGSGLLLFSLGFGFALLYGVLLRTGSNWGDLVPQTRVIQLAPDADAETRVDAALLDRLLASLRVEPDTRQAIVSQLHTSCTNEAGREKIAIKSVFDAISAARSGETGDTSVFQLLNAWLDPSQKKDLYGERDTLQTALLQATKLVQGPDSSTSNPSVASALNTFIATTIDFLDCSGSDTVVANVLANMAKLEGTFAKDAISRHPSVEDGLGR
ncbi:hypothetical protein HFN49_00025 [Rhizobium leguminosarum]|uniref:hypothetical protein n=1 Tax=Rhizobium ruizarguesonis TaxID=2081791 RepID=UPI001A98A5AA|nr:hypothetical protein [Rhizobium ruizarguesonis]MBY5884587.1 hypothetical protein [Rhizobium leguminosarum]QSZ05152.1 hypothetical protein J3P73_31585 [Rhizobium ruizarguesonis]